MVSVVLFSETASSSAGAVLGLFFLCEFAVFVTSTVFSATTSFVSSAFTSCTGSASGISASTGFSATTSAGFSTFFLGAGFFAAGFLGAGVDFSSVFIGVSVALK